ncbi:hypothetical protein U1Q18_023730 [Sarracenia purpurea var. burkii]
MASASRNEARDDDLNYCSGGGRRRGQVDENLIVLRKRIHEMKMKERNYEPPSHWMEWDVGFEFMCTKEEDGVAERKRETEIVPVRNTLFQITCS